MKVPAFPKATALAAIAAFASGVLVAYAAERTVGQKGRTFSQSEISIKTGEAVVFANDDNVTHNVISTSPGNQFDLGAEAPGVAIPVTFKTAGDVVIICAIHPRMRMVVKVRD